MHHAARTLRHALPNRKQVDVPMLHAGLNNANSQHHCLGQSSIVLTIQPCFLGLLQAVWCAWQLQLLVVDC